MEPFINLEEKIGKTVGRRRAPQNAFRYAMGLQKTLVQLSRSTGQGICPKGVYRFQSHESADAWLWKMMSRPRTSRS